MNTQLSWPRVGAALFVCSLSGLANNALAQTSTSGALEEVVVSAQRTEENLQKTPIAVTSVTSETLDKLGNGNVAMLQMVTPSLQVSGTGAGTLIGIRGIITANGTDVGDPAVAFETDGLYHSRSGTQGSTLFDVDRVEVLRGPQGTLYGRNATTGVINVISKKPTKDFGGEGYIEAGNYNALSAFAALNVPVSESVAVRGAFVSRNRDPIYNNGLGRGQDYGDLHETAGRLSGLINFTDDVSLLLRASYDQITGNGPPQNVAIPLSRDPFTFRAAGPGSVNATQWTGQAVFDWRTPLATFTYEGGYHKSDSFARISSGFPTIVADPTASSTQQHELRASNSTDAFKYVAGLFYFEEEQEWMIYVDPFVRFLMPDEGQNSKAAYAQATYSITDALRVTGGLRYTKDEKARTGANYAFSRPGDATSPIVQTLANFADISSSKLNYKFGVDFDVTDASLFYGSVATGYKQGGFFDGDQTTTDNSYAPENVLSFELGYKSRFFDDRLQLNLAAFRYKYTDFQVSFQDAILVTRTYNAQEARNTGLEIELEAAPTQNDRLGLSATWLRARYEQFDLPQGPDVYGNSSYTGNRLPHAPDYVLNLHWDHTWDLANDRQITLGLLSHWQSEVDLEFHGFENTKQGSYSRSDASLSWGDAARHYTITAFVRNIEDELVLVSAALPNNTSNPNARATGSLAQPRTYGLRVDFRL